MPEYEYKGPHPVVDEENVLVHPGDVREFDEPPDWGLWEMVPDEEAEPAAPPLAPPETTPPLPGGLFETPPHLAAQGILARDVQPLQPVKPLEGGI